MKNRVMLLLSVLLLPIAVVGDEVEVSDVESEFSTYKDVKATKELKQSINIGFSNLTGNTETMNLNGKYTMAVMRSGYKDRPLEIMFDASAFVSENNDVKDNEEYSANLALEQSIVDKWLTYASIHWLRNKFKNYDNKSSFAVGLGKEIYNDGQHKFKARAGFAYNVQQFTNDQSDEEFISFNQYLEYTNKLNKISDLYVKLGAFENFEDFSNDYELLVVAGFNFAVAQDISVILEAEVNYDNLPPVGFEKTDTKTIVRVGYNF